MKPTHAIESKHPPPWGERSTIMCEPRLKPNGPHFDGRAHYA